MRDTLPQQVLVMGLGIHGGGLGAACWLLRQGIDVTVTDMASAEALATSLTTLHHVAQESGSGSITYVLGEHRAADFTHHAMVVVNPAVPPDSPWLQMARAAGARIESDMTLFFAQCNGLIIGITGTKGKTTTAMLTAAMLRQQFPDVVVAGNLRVSALDALDRIQPTTPVVLELSSFQLMALNDKHYSPPYACITNFSPDHLNYHGTLAAYADAKRTIFRHQAADGIVVLPYDEYHTQHHVWCKESAPHRSVITFSTDATPDADCTIDSAGNILCCGEWVASTADIQLTGKHNWANVLAATAVTRCFGLTATKIRAAIQAFRGVEHRLELVATLNGVRYINDTTATNPTATEAALTSITGNIILIAGGADKGLPMESLARAIVAHTTALVLLKGSATPLLEQHVRDVIDTTQKEDMFTSHNGTHSDIPPLQATAIVGHFEDLAAAIHYAYHIAMPGDVVLLSPACASFGMFHNEFHRGEEFRRIVAALTA